MLGSVYAFYFLCSKRNYSNPNPIALISRFFPILKKRASNVRFLIIFLYIKKRQAVDVEINFHSSGTGNKFPTFKCRVQPSYANPIYYIYHIWIFINRYINRDLGKGLSRNKK